MGRNIKVMRDFEAGTLGLGILFGNAMGDSKGIEEVAKDIAKINQIYKPNMAKHDIYKEKMKTYKKIYNKIKELIRTK